jgi:hypothetical protein
VTAAAGSANDNGARGEIVRRSDALAHEASAWGDYLLCRAGFARAGRLTEFHELQRSRHLIYPPQERLKELPSLRQALGQP